MISVAHTLRQWVLEKKISVRKFEDMKKNYMPSQFQEIHGRGKVPTYCVTWKSFPYEYLHYRKKTRNRNIYISPSLVSPTSFNWCDSWEQVFHTRATTSPTTTDVWPSDQLLRPTDTVFKAAHSLTTIFSVRAVPVLPRSFVGKSGEENAEELRASGY